MTKEEIRQKIEYLKVLLKVRESTKLQGFTEKEKEDYLNESLDLINELQQTLNELENE
ncbi:MAG: hypothetical protein M3004_00060 [Bacteroidota bacterium]|nr:hypothetical protein [Bacteroidota bacterium]